MKLLIVFILFTSCATKHCYQCDIELYECAQPCDSISSEQTLIECDLTKYEAEIKESSLNYETRDRHGYKKSKSKCYKL